MRERKYLIQENHDMLIRQHLHRNESSADAKMHLVYQIAYVWLRIQKSNYTGTCYAEEQKKKNKK